MINNVSLTGRITNDLDIKYTHSQRAVVNFNIAVNRPFSNGNGQNETDFVRCIAFGKTAENMVKYLGKGSLIGVEGRIQTRTYDKSGQKNYVTEVIVNNLTFLESKKDNKAQVQHATFDDNTTLNFNNNDPFANFGNTVDISDDDLPF